jgi:hypothetical protein
MLGLKEKTKTHAWIEYWQSDKVVTKTAGKNLNSLSDKLRDLARVGKIKEIKVKSDDERFDELGRINGYGNIDKQIRNTDKFHRRWINFRGFQLYWFR